MASDDETHLKFAIQEESAAGHAHQGDRRGRRRLQCRGAHDERRR